MLLWKMSRENLIFFENKKRALNKALKNVSVWEFLTFLSS